MADGSGMAENDRRPRGEGSSLDELKAVVRDPEWLAAPDAKAMKVAADCLREMGRVSKPEGATKR
jgi:hypothetical protein